MKRFNMPGLLALAILSLAPAAVAQTADEILAANVVAIGGADAAKDLKSYIFHGSMTMMYGMTVKMVSYVKGDKMFARQTVESMGLEMVMGCDGTDCYANDQMMGLRLLEGQDKDQMVTSNDFTAALDWKDLYKTREYKGEVEENGRPAHNVYLETEQGMKMHNLYDKETNMLVKSTFTVKSPMGEITGEMWFDEYKDIHNGFKVPVKMHTKTMGMAGTVEFTEIEVNVEIPDSKFDLPADLKK